MIRIRTLDELTFPRGARVFYRVDYNVPLEGTRITDTTRIDETGIQFIPREDEGSAEHLRETSLWATVSQVRC